MEDAAFSIEIGVPNQAITATSTREATCFVDRDSCAEYASRSDQQGEAIGGLALPRPQGGSAPGDILRHDGRKWRSTGTMGNASPISALCLHIAAFTSAAARQNAFYITTPCNMDLQLSKGIGADAAQ